MIKTIKILGIIIQLKFILFHEKVFYTMSQIIYNFYFVSLKKMFIFVIIKLTLH